MTKDDFMRGVRKKLSPLESQTNDMNFLEVLNKMIQSKEMEVFIEGYSDNKIHKHDARIELWTLYKARDLFTKEETQMKLYVITAGAYEDYHIIATCTDKTKADQICNEYNKSYNNIPYGKASVTEYEDKSDLDLNQNVYYVKYDNPPSAHELHGEDKVDALCEVYHLMNKVYMHKDRPIFIYLTANSKEEAIQRAESILEAQSCK